MPISISRIYAKKECSLHLLPEKEYQIYRGKVEQGKVSSLLTSKSLKMRTHQRIRPLNPTGNVDQQSLLIVRTCNVLAMVREKPVSDGRELARGT